MTTPLTTPPPRGPSDDGADAGPELARLTARVAELERERDQLVAVIDILQGISSSLHFEDILQTIARKMGEAYGLDRCSIYLAGDAREVRLVATYEDPTLRNLIVDLDRYPELRQAFESGKTVYIPDAAADPLLRPVRERLATRNVRSIIVAPIRWNGATIGAIFLRSERAASPFSDHDVRFCQVIASLTANALHHARRFERLRRARAGEQGADGRRRDALVTLLRLLLDGYAAGRERHGDETLPADVRAQLERLAEMVLRTVNAGGSVS